MVTSPEESRLPPGSLVQQLVGEIRTIPQAQEILLHTLLPQRFLELPERMDSLGASINDVRDEVSAVRDELTIRIDGVRDEVSAVRDELTIRIDGVRDEVSAVRDEVSAVRDELTTRMDGVRDELTTRIDGVRDELTIRIDGVRDELTIRIDGVRDELTTRMDVMQGDINGLKGQFGNLRGESYEDKCSETIELVLVDYVDRPVLADRGPINDALVQARRNGTISRAQYDRVRVVDIIAVGAELARNRPILAIVEASVTINEYDVNAAHERAIILRNITGQDTRPFCVANVRWSNALARTAGELGVTLIHYELPNYSDSSQC